MGRLSVFVLKMLLICFFILVCMETVPDNDYVELQRGFSRDSLFHKGTGELVHLVGRWELTRTSCGFAQLQADTELSGQADPTWCRSLCSKVLHAVTKDDTTKHYVVQKATGTGDWQQKLQQEGMIHKVFGGNFGTWQFLGGVFISPFPAGEACVRWSLEDISIDCRRRQRWEVGRPTCRCLPAETSTVWIIRGSHSSIPTILCIPICYGPWRRTTNVMFDAIRLSFFSLDAWTCGHRLRHAPK